MDTELSKKLKNIQNDAERSLRCRWCEKVIAHTHLAIHLQTQHYKEYGLSIQEVKPYKCTKCSDDQGRFAQQWELNRHYKIKHAPESEKTCDQCGKILADLDQLSQHKRTHSPQVKCGYCAKIYATNHSLKKHCLVKHEKKMAASTRNSLISAEKKENPNTDAKIDLNSLAPDETFCVLCHFDYDSFNHLKQHMIDEHHALENNQQPTTNATKRKDNPLLKIKR